MTLRKILLALVVLVAVASWLIWRFVLAPANPNDSNVVRVSGNIELIDVEMAFKIPGLVAERRVDEGYVVYEGELVAKLETGDLLADLEMREAELGMARAAYEELQNGSRPAEKAAAWAAVEKAAAAIRALQSASPRQTMEAARALAALRAAKLEQDRLKEELDRADRVMRLNPKAISREDYDRQEAAYKVAIQRHQEAQELYNLTDQAARRELIDQAEQAFNQAGAQWNLVEEGARQEVRDQAAQKVKQAAAATRLAWLRLNQYAVLRVPPPADLPLARQAQPAKSIQGGPTRGPAEWVVLAKHVERGEYVAAGTPVVTVGDMKHVWLRAYIEEQDLSRVKLRQRARVTTDGRPGSVYQGEVSFISQEAEFTPKNVQTPKERVKLVYRIKIDIDNPQMELKRGMPADAEILLDSPATGVSAAEGK